MAYLQTDIFNQQEEIHFNNVLNLILHFFIFKLRKQIYGTKI